ncbi:hypothetical protein CAPTEDRAFT_184942 [Capitella teleta]|uniref:Apple domain-containing protein n=1 Tax=Capitella teleta TaxID=283909 RepID=R7ULX6_CAPTE|nr:hypothetical protein CAPTEDRAFT_184942 [Capitella teleta]|eukprot:ELU04942.1 hypothetical protein CAPTEDRAFT_184942 [Capitella teleta]
MAALTPLVLAGIVSVLLAEFHVAHGLPNGCSWVSVKTKRLNSWNNLTADAIDINKCREICEKRIYEGFKCRSVDFSPVRRRCVLSEGDRADSYLRNYFEKDWKYNEIQCPDDGRNRSSCTLVGPVRGHAIPDSSIPSNAHSGFTLDKCEEVCRLEKRFFCISFNFKSSEGLCVLQQRDTKEVRLAEVPSFDYYELSCDPDVDLQTAATDDQLCSIKGPLDGYLGSSEGPEFVADLADCREYFEITRQVDSQWKAFSYDALLRHCYFHDKTCKEAAIVPAWLFHYYEYSCDPFDDLVKQCFIS